MATNESDSTNEPSTRSRGGRPPRPETTKRADVFLRLSDARALERLGPDWAEATDTMTSIKVTPIVRSLVAVMMPILQDLDPPTDEDQLREFLRERLAPVLLKE